MTYNIFAFARVSRFSPGEGKVRPNSFSINAWRAVALSLVLIAAAPCISVAEEKLGNLEQKVSASPQNFQDWSVRCADLPRTGSHEQTAPVHAACEAAQTVTIEQNGQKVEILKLAVSPAKDKAGKSDWALVALFPLDILLNSDFGLSTGKEKPTLYRFRNCNHLGCFGVVPLDKAMLARFGKSPEGAMYFRLLNGKAVKVLFSLNGFGSAFEALQSRTKAEETNNSPVSGIKK